MSLIDKLEMADKQATLAINSLHCPFSDAVWQIFSDKEIWYVLYIAVLVFLFIRLGWKKTLAVLLSCILTVVVCDQGGNVCKDFFMRMRPCWDAYMIQNGLYMLEGEGNAFGFYSAHAANAMGFAICSLYGFRNDSRCRYRGYAWPIVIWAVLVGLSRVFVGKHFLGDVIVGLLVGLLAGRLLAAAASFAIRKFRL